MQLTLAETSLSYGGNTDCISTPADTDKAGASQASSAGDRQPVCLDPSDLGADGPTQVRFEKYPSCIYRTKTRSFL